MVYGVYNYGTHGVYTSFFVDISFLFKWGYSGIYSYIYILYMMYMVSVQYTSMRLSIQGSKKMVVETSNKLGFKQLQKAKWRSEQSPKWRLHHQTEGFRQ